MSQAVPAPMSVSAFLAWAERRPEGERYELIDGVLVAMAPERFVHNRAKLAIATALETAIRRAGVDCVTCTDGMTVPIDEYTAYEPDALVHCGGPIAGETTVVTDPVVIVEVLSPGTRNIDAGVKLAGYFRLVSVKHYLIIEPQRKLILHYQREPEGNIGVNIVTAGMLSLSPPGLELTVADLFARPE